MGTASVCMHGLSVFSRHVQDLPKALDYLMVLTAIKQRMLSATVGSFEDRVRQAIQSVTDEQRALVSEMVMGFRVQFQMRRPLGINFWSHRVYDLEQALDMLKYLGRFRGGTIGRPNTQECMSRLKQFDSEWQSFRDVYGCMMKSLGIDHESSDKKLNE